ncbi:hypothetical protein ACP70R_011630 [Stipagrostis hirtigluma subsp. patula]
MERCLFLLSLTALTSHFTVPSSPACSSAAPDGPRTAAPSLAAAVSGVTSRRERRER